MSEARASAAFDTVERGMGSVMAMARREADHRRWRDAAEDVAGAVADLAPELRVLREARRHGVRARRRMPS